MAGMISPVERTEAIRLFATFNVYNGLVTGAELSGFLKQTGLPDAALSKIWDLADSTNRGSLNQDEFAVLMHYVKRVRAGQPLPGMGIERPVSMYGGGYVGMSGKSDPFSVGHPVPGHTALHAQQQQQQPASPAASSAVHVGGGAYPLSVRSSFVAGGGVGPVSPVVVGGPYWAVSTSARTRAADAFSRLAISPMNGVLSGAQAQGILIQTGLPTTVLADVWRLADINGKGFLTINELAVAFHLIDMVRQSVPLPAYLPPDLVPPPQGSPVDSFAAQSTAFGGVSSSLRPNDSMAGMAMPLSSPSPSSSLSSSSSSSASAFASASVSSSGLPIRPTPAGKSSSLNDEREANFAASKSVLEERRRALEAEEARIKRELEEARLAEERKRQEALEKRRLEREAELLRQQKRREEEEARRLKEERQQAMQKADLELASLSSELVKLRSFLDERSGRYEALATEVMGLDSQIVSQQRAREEAEQEVQMITALLATLSNASAATKEGDGDDGHGGALAAGGLSAHDLEVLNGETNAALAEKERLLAEIEELTAERSRIELDLSDVAAELEKAEAHLAHQRDELAKEQAKSDEIKQSDKSATAELTSARTRLHGGPTSATAFPEDDLFGGAGAKTAGGKKIGSEDAFFFGSSSGGAASSSATASAATATSDAFGNSFGADDPFAAKFPSAGGAGGAGSGGEGNNKKSVVSAINSDALFDWPSQVSSSSSSSSSSAFPTSFEFDSTRGFGTTSSNAKAAAFPEDDFFALAAAKKKTDAKPRAGGGASNVDDWFK